MDITILQARETLEQQLEPLATEAAELSTRLAEIKQTQNQLEAAIKALGGNAKASKPKKPTKPCAKQEEVMVVCKSVCYEAGTISQSELEDAVKQELRGDFNLSGVKLRIAECLATKAFSVGDNGAVQLVQPSSEISAATQTTSNTQPSWPVDDVKKVCASALK